MEGYAATGVDGYDDRPDLTEVQWNTLLANLDDLSWLFWLTAAPFADEP